MSNRRVSKVGRAPVRSREVLSANGTQVQADLAYCKTRRATVEIHECGGCPRCVGGSSSEGLACWMDTLELDRPPAPHFVGRVDLREAASVASAAEVMSGGQLTVTADLSLEQLRALFVDRSVHAAPVVDEEGKLAGIVSEVDILRWQQSSHDLGGKEPTVGNFMTKVAHALPEDAPLAFAFGLLAACGIREAPVVAQDGRVVGMITATDLLRWVARDLGYVLPE